MIWIIVLAAIFALFLWAKSNNKKAAGSHGRRNLQRQVSKIDNKPHTSPVSVSPGAENRRRVAAILATRQSVTSAPYSKADIDELTSVAIDQSGPKGQNHTIVSSLDLAIPTPPNAITPPPQGWIAPGQSVVIAGLNVPGGMIYVGQSLDPANFTNCLINPSLSVASIGDHSGAHMGYWPSYGSILPQERRAFLEWLAAGRQAPNAYIGYVFLFFYGLERRMFIDEAVEERRAIEDEVRRLLRLYGSNGSFRGYATRFLDILALLDLSGQKVPEPTAYCYSGYELPNVVKLHIGSKIADKLPLDADDALLWVLNAPDTYLRTPATRCFSEFKTLWKILFEQAYPAGMQVSAPKARLNVSYQAAMGFSASVKVLKSGERMPDISNLSAPVEKLRAIVTQCTDALDPYSRYIGRNPDNAGKLAAARLLPTQLIATNTHPVLAKVNDGILSLIGVTSGGFVLASDLIGLLEIEEGAGGLTRSQCAQIGIILDKLDLAFEPDARYGSSAFSGESSIYLFKAAAGAPVDGAAPPYSLARMMIEVAVVAAAADGNLISQEFEVIEQSVINETGLNDIEKSRLMGLAASLWRNIPKQQGILKRLADLPEVEKRKIADTAIDAIVADGVVDPKEVAFLEKLYKALGYAPEEVYSALHRGTSTPNGASSERAGEPTKIRTAAGSIQIDLARLQRIKGETDVVSQMLADIFTDDAQTIAMPARLTKPAIGSQHFRGLDAAHTQLFSEILANGQLDRRTFDERARALKLLPEGALETLNEWGFDNLEEPILDGDDVLSIPAHLIEPLKDYVVA